MPFRRYQNDADWNDGKVWRPTEAPDTWKWYPDSGDEAFVPGQWYVFRIPVDIPKGATIHDATWGTEFVVKNAGTVPQSATFEVAMEANSAPYPKAEATLGPYGTFPVAPRQRVWTQTIQTMTYAVDTPTADHVFFNIRQQLQECIDAHDYVPGCNVAVMLYCSSESGDLSFRMANHDFANKHPAIDVNWSFPEHADNRRWRVNLSPEQTFEELHGNWWPDTAFDSYVAGTTLTSVADPVNPANKVLKITSGPADPAAPNKGFSAHGQYKSTTNTPYIFSGKIYIPSVIPTTNVNVHAEFLFVGNHIFFGSVRDQWIEFSINSFTTGKTYGNVLPSVGVVPVADSGVTVSDDWFVLVDNITLRQASFPEVPFNADTADTYNKEHYKLPDYNSYGQSVRATRARSYTWNRAKNVLDNTNNTSYAANTSHGGTGITFTAANDTVVGTVGANLSPATATWTWTRALSRGRRFLAIQTSGAPTTLTEILFNNSDPMVNPPVTATDGDWKFYDLGLDNNRNGITKLTFSVQSTTSAQTFTLHEIAETRVAAIGQAHRPGTRYLKQPNGLWLEAEMQRQSMNWADPNLAGKTWGDLAASGKTWDELGATDTI